mgnify:CR=1 FL=1
MTAFSGAAKELGEFPCLCGTVADVGALGFRLVRGVSLRKRSSQLLIEYLEGFKKAAETKGQMRQSLYNKRLTCVLKTSITSFLRGP